MIELFIVVALLALGGFFVGGVKFGAGVFIATAIVLIWLAIRDSARVALGKLGDKPQAKAEAKVASWDAWKNKQITKADDAINRLKERAAL